MDRAMRVIYDIETVATEKAKELVSKKRYELPGNIKPVDSWPVRYNDIKDEDIRQGHILDWQDKQREKIKAHVTLKQLKDLETAALHWWTSKICSIAWIMIDPIDNAIVDSDVSSCGQEMACLEDFFNYLEDHRNEISGLIGKNSVYFDLPFLVGRCLANDCGVPDILRTNVSKLGDINQIFGVMSSQNAGITKLDNYAFGLGIDGKTSQGSNVAKMYDNGDWVGLAEYNMRDVEIVAEMFLRWNKPYRNV